MRSQALKARPRRRRLRPQATAPILDSTRLCKKAWYRHCRRTSLAFARLNAIFLESVLLTALALSRPLLRPFEYASAANRPGHLVYKRKSGQIWPRTGVHLENVGSNASVWVDLSEETHGAVHAAEKRKAKQLDLHPLHAVYRRACLAPIEAQLRAGDLRMMGFFAQVRTRYVSRAEALRFDLQLRSFFNVNTPEEWAEAERLAKGEGVTG